jgi:hypothetical protein
MFVRICLFPIDVVEKAEEVATLHKAGAFGFCLALWFGFSYLVRWNHGVDVLL